MKESKVLQDDGDIVRGLGFATLYASYLEERIDNLLCMLNTIERFDDKKQQWPISKKIKHAINLLTKLDTGEFPELSVNLQTCLDLFEDRNKLVHGRIYANFDRPDTLKSGRPSVPDREVESGELYKLANEFFDFSLEVYRPMISKLPKAVNKYMGSDV